MNKTGFEEIEEMLKRKNFIEAQKEFESKFTPEQRSLFIKPFVAFVVRNIRKLKEEIVDSEYYKETIIPLPPKDKYQEKLFSLEENTNSYLISTKQNELSQFEDLFNRIEPNGYNLCYCVWLYNKGDFRTKEERKWAKGLLNFYTSGLKRKSFRFRVIRDYICGSIAFFPVLFTVISLIYSIIFIPACVIDKHLYPINFTNMLEPKPTTLGYKITQLLIDIGDNLWTITGMAWVSIGEFNGLVFIPSCLLALMLVMIITFIYKLTLSKDARLMVETYSNDWGYSIITHFALGALLTGFINKKLTTITSKFKNSSN